MKYSHSLYLLWYKSNHDLCLGAISGETLRALSIEDIQKRIMDAVREGILDELQDIEGEEMFQRSPNDFSISGDNGIITLELIPCKWI